MKNTKSLVQKNHNGEIITHSHNGEITLDHVQSRIVKIQGRNVLLDSDVAMLYDVETKRVNEAVRNNLDKFPEGYILEVDREELESSRSKISTLKSLGRGHNLKYPPKAFTEKGLYMLATILKSERATATTIAIVEAFAKMRELSTAVAELVKSPDDVQKQAAVSQKSGEILSDLVTKELKTTGTETTYEFNLLSAIKIKHTVKKEFK